MSGERIRQIIGGILLVIVMSLGFSTGVKEWIQLPTSVTMFEGEEISDVITNFQSTKLEQNDQSSLTMKAGSFPIKSIDVNVLKNIEVIPGGQSIGVKLNTEGVLVIGHHAVLTKNGQTSPAEEAGIKVGDMITKIDNERIKSLNDFVRYVQKAGHHEKSVVLEVKRDQETFTTTLNPQKAKGGESFKVGLYIRNSAAGIGTMTFIDPKTKKYGALGHVISDANTQKPLVIHGGEILRSSVTSIEKGKNGDPGEKFARFTNENERIGTIDKNSTFGIFGTLKELQIKNNIYDQKMPIALAEHVKEGPAQILTVLEGEKVEAFDIEIVRSTPQKKRATKGMVIKVTDPKLLETTGGIVQGMSGSPIIQDGKLIGAVTHVFVNDPTSGYACHISWMLEEVGVSPEKQAEAS